MMRSRLITPISIALITAVVICPFFLPGTARAESWNRIGSGGLDGPYDQVKIRAASMVEFNSRLYVGADNSDRGGLGCEVWCYDKVSWHQVNIDGFGDKANQSVGSMAVAGGMLYVGTVNINGCEVWRTDGSGAAPYSWTKVSSSGNVGAAANVSASSMSASSSGLLYLGTTNYGGCQLWTYSGTAWSEVIGGGSGPKGPGFGDSNNSMVSAMAWKGTALYAGTDNGIGGCEVWSPSGATWVQASQNGFNLDVNNTRVSAMAVFNNKLYAGTDNANVGCQVWRYDGPNPANWSKVDTDGFGAVKNTAVLSMTVFGGRLYAGTRNYDVGCQVWRLETSPNWTQVNASGFGDKTTNELPSMVSFDSKLFAGTTNDSGCAIYGTAGGSVPYVWTAVNTRGFATSSNTEALCSSQFKGKLYVGTSSGLGCQVLAYDGSGWVKVNTDGFGDRFNNRAMSMAATASYLYVGTENYMTGCEVWRYDGSTWNKINVDGFYNKSTSEAPSMAIFQSKLYVGTSSYPSPYATVWRWDDPNWTQVNTNGFGSSKNVGVQSMFVFSSKLYAATNGSNDPCQVWRYDGPNPANWTKINNNGFGDAQTTEVDSMTSYNNKLYAAAYNRTMHGCEVWRYDGPNPANWTKVNANGFGDAHNSSPGQMAIFGGRLYAGTHNWVTGGEVWSYDGATWKQENSDGFGTAANAGVDFMLSNGSQIWAGTENELTGCEVWALASAPVSWYLAEGTTAWGFSTYISIENPNATAVHANVTYLTGGGQVPGGTVVLAPNSQATVNPADTLGAQDFSTWVVCNEGKNIAVDRTMEWTGQGAASPEAHSSVGVTAPARTWYLPEGSSAWGFECWLLIQNPSGSQANCMVTYMLENGPPLNVTKTVPPFSRKSFNIAGDIGAADASIKVVADVPVIPERAMYRNGRREGHDSIGTTSPSPDYYLAEGTSAWGFTTYVLVQNPNSGDAVVTVTYMTPSGPKAQAPFALPANSRKTIRVNDALPNTDFSTLVHGTLPIIAERSMYWDSGTGETCHDSIGLDQAHTTFYMPDGQTSNGRETWTLVQNPNSSAVSVQIGYLTPSGAGDQYSTVSIPANSRRSFKMSEKIPDGRAAVRVICKTPGKKIMCERAMYWNARGTGTDTIGGSWD